MLSQSAHRRTLLERDGTFGGMTYDSCGTDTDELHAVHRKYVTPGSWDQERHGTLHSVG